MEDERAALTWIEAALPARRRFQHPARRCQRAARTIAQPRDPHRRRPGPASAQPRAAGAGARPRRDGVRDGPPGARQPTCRCTSARPARHSGAGSGLAEADAQLTPHRRDAAGAGGRLPSRCAGAPGAVAAVHCGWRGVAAGIVPRARRRRCGELGSGPDDLRGVGPGIGACCYEVGPEVVARSRARARRRVRTAACSISARGSIELRRDGVADDVADGGLCTSCNAELFFSHRRDGGVTASGRPRLARLLEHVDPARVRANLAAVRERDRRGMRARGPRPVRGRAAGGDQVRAARADGRAGAGGHRARGREHGPGAGRKAGALGRPFTCDFIGHLQSRKTKQVLPRVRLIHSVESDSVVEQIERHASSSRRVLLEVNVAGEELKYGVAPRGRRASSSAPRISQASFRGAHDDAAV